MGTGRPLASGTQPTPDLQTQAVTHAAVEGSTIAAQHSGTTPRSIQRWLNDPQLSGVELRAFVATKQAEWASETLEKVLGGWQQAYETVSQRLSEPGLSPSDIKSLVTAYAILVDKRQVLTGGPTSTRFGVSVQHHTSDKQPRVDVSKLLSANEPEQPDAT